MRVYATIYNLPGSQDRQTETRPITRLDYRLSRLLQAHSSLRTERVFVPTLVLWEVLNKFIDYAISPTQVVTKRPPMVMEY